MGGVRGRTNTHSIGIILEDYNNTYRGWSNITFNALEIDPNNIDFLKEKEKFDNRVEILERRLAFVFEQNFMDCRELKICGSLLTRPIVKQQLEPQFVAFVKDFNNELNAVASDFAKFAKTYMSSGIEVCKKYDFLKENTIQFRF